MNQVKLKVQVARSDNALEYIDNIRKSFFVEHGVIHQTTCVNSPQ